MLIAVDVVFPIRVNGWNPEIPCSDRRTKTVISILELVFVTVIIRGQHYLDRRMSEFPSSLLYRSYLAFLV